MESFSWPSGRFTSRWHRGWLAASVLKNVRMLLVLSDSMVATAAPARRVELKDLVDDGHQSFNTQAVVTT